jgi:hypothetical protein
MNVSKNVTLGGLGAGAKVVGTGLHPSLKLQMAKQGLGLIADY